MLQCRLTFSLTFSLTFWRMFPLIFPLYFLRRLPCSTNPTPDVHC